VVREVVLVPGPDMVRIEGGAFRMGPPGPSYWDPEYDPSFFEPDYSGSEDDDGLEPPPPGRWPGLHVFDVDVATFDMDRTEVTTAQFHACRKAEGCPGDRRGILLTEKPPKNMRGFCTTDVWDEARIPKPGMESHPMNCLPQWEAEDYCTWVGKRLPTEVEWEFAARSRNVDYSCPWGPPTIDAKGEHSCRRRPEIEVTAPPCGHTEDETEQGLCDMMWNVAEWVTRVPERKPEIFVVEAPGIGAFRGSSSWNTDRMPFEDGRESSMSESVSIGFRCVRDVPAVAEARRDEGGTREP
jgi:formylglycine-generating enzyme required for sulfatase activity